MVGNRRRRSTATTALLSIADADAETHANRGLVLRALKRFDEVFEAYDRALALKPDYVEVIVARGNLFYEMHSYDKALEEYERALLVQPDFAFGFNNRGNALQAMGRNDEAIASFERALALKPDLTAAHNNRGNALLNLNRPEEALADYESAIAHKPFAFALVNRGSALHYLGRIEEALDSFNRAIALQPDLPEAHWNKALLCLAVGDFEQGWPAYEWRWRGATELTPRGFSQPQWRGEDLNGKTILLHAEQGFGDSIQFVRYLPIVARKGCKVVLELPDSLMPLIPDTDGLVSMHRRGDALPAFDVHCPLMSLPLAFGTTVTTIPASTPYLRAPAERIDAWRARLAHLGKPRIGLVWSGKPSHKNDHNRSIALSRLEPLLAVPDVTFVSLQREYREAEQPALARLPILRLDEAITDFADTAAAIAELDLVIAVDTAVAHLVGALGRPLWLLLSHIQDWRWMHDRVDSPWYPKCPAVPAIADRRLGQRDSRRGAGACGLREGRRRTEYRRSIFCPIELACGHHGFTTQTGGPAPGAPPLPDNAADLGCVCFCLATELCHGRRRRRRRSPAVGRFRRTHADQPRQGSGRLGAGPGCRAVA